MMSLQHELIYLRTVQNSEGDNGTKLKIQNGKQARNQCECWKRNSAELTEKGH